MPKIVLNNVTGGQDLSQINNNFQKIADELNNKVLYRDNPIAQPNSMEGALDMNEHPIYNLPQPVRPSDPARLQDVQDAVANPTSAVLTTFVPYGTLEATNVQHAIQEIHDLIPGISEATPTIEALTVSVGELEDRMDEVEGDIASINTAISGIAVDVNLVHKTGNETVSGIKSFVSSPTVPTPASNDATTKVPNTSWVQGNFVHNTGNETIYGTKTFASPPIGIQLPAVFGEVGTYCIAVQPDAPDGVYYNAGTDVLGSSLRVNVPSGIGVMESTGGWNSAWGSPLGGTWRRMGGHVAFSITNVPGDSESGIPSYNIYSWNPCLFLRIA